MIKAEANRIVFVKYFFSATPVYISAIKLSWNTTIFRMWAIISSHDDSFILTGTNISCNIEAVVFI